MHDVKLIFNPMCDHGRSGQKASDLQSIVEKLGGADWAGTEYPGHAVEIAAKAGDLGYNKVVALGGDGTVHEVVNGLMRIPQENRPSLGVVPIGSGNDFAFSSNINLNPIEAMKNVFIGTPSLIDVSRITDGNGRSAFWDNSAGMLFDAAVNIQSRNITFIHGFLMYFTATVRSIIENFDPVHMKLTIDGKLIERELLLFTIGNGAREAGGFLVTPEAKIDDGWLDYLMVDPISRPMMFRLLPEVMKGNHARFDCVTLGKCRTIEIEANNAVPIHLDGELWASYETNVNVIKIEIFPDAINLIR